jgi:hypothetical protein
MVEQSAGLDQSDRSIPKGAGNNPERLHHILPEPPFLNIC